MIINKTQLGENWPFTVDEVEILTKFKGFILKHKKFLYAISGFLEFHSYLPLEQSGIWADDPEMPGVKKSLTPLFEFLEQMG